ncbi:MAG: hypothetical protein IPO92_13680, partial [Saprospiraceae bacterium]|nr:hypothetical protein [Saprospiraceae bacterium]
ACGLSIYGGRKFPQTYQGNIFSPEPCGHLIKRVVLSQKGDSIHASLPYINKEFLTSTDQRFRPVFTTTGPDEALYVVDMHRGLIQHSTYLTNYLRKHVVDEKLASPIHMCRIFRITHVNQKNTKITYPIGNTSELVHQLSHPNRWNRIKAQWSLAASKDTSFIPKLHSIIDSSTNDISKIHAMWLLENHNDITKKDIDNLLLSKNVELNKLGIHLASRLKIEVFSKIEFPNSRVNTMLYVSASSQYIKEDFNAALTLITDLSVIHKSDSVLCGIIAGGILEQANTVQRKKFISKLSALGLENNYIVKWL